MTRALLITIVALAGISCGGSTNPSVPITGSFVLVEENGQPLPSDPSAPYGCCITRGGELTLTATTYDLATAHTNKNNGINFDNSERGTYTRRGNTLTFTRVSNGGAGHPYLLGPGTVSADHNSVTLLYGDEGPGSDQTRAVFQRR